MIRTISRTFIGMVAVGIAATAPVLLARSAWSSPEDIPSLGLSWSVDRGNNTVTAAKDSIQIIGSAPARNSIAASATARLGVVMPGRDNPWSISFDVKFGPVADRASGVFLLSGADPVVRLTAGGDDGTNASAYVGDKAMPAYYYPAEDLAGPVWHSVSFRGNGDHSTVEIWIDGDRVGSDSCGRIPDLIKIGASSSDTENAKQTGVSIRRFKSTGIKAQGAITSGGSSLPYRDGPVGSPVAVPFAATAPTPTPVVTSTTTTLVATSVQSPFVFVDNFAGGVPNSRFWRWSTAGGAIVYRDGGLLMLQSPDNTDYPVMVSRPGAFPAGSSWKVTVIARFPTNGDYGVGVKLLNSEDDGAMLWSGRDASSASGTIGYHRQFLKSDPALWHEFVVENKGGTWAYWLDGDPVATGIKIRQDREPSLMLGNGGKQKPWDWANVSIRQVRVEWTAGARPSWLSSLSD